MIVGGASAARGSILLALATAATACAGVSAGTSAPSSARSVPGFDTRTYPGDEALRAWRDASPYRWVGYYLPAPCYTGRSWVGKRASLERMRWGIAVLFLGEQDWAAAPSDSIPPPEAARCTRSNLSAANGAAHAREAADAAAAEGFAAGTVVYLDVERVDSVSRALADYVRVWVSTMLEIGDYVPGLYAHERNARELLDIAAAEFAAARAPGASPPLWVVDPSGFDLRRSPAESGFPEASIWQGRLDVRESWGGVTLTIDANVAAVAAAASMTR